MKLSALAALLIVALLVAGCGSGGTSGSSSTAPGNAAPGGARSTNPGGPIKKATAPNAPAGSKVVACGAGAGVTAMAQLRATAVGCDVARTTMRHWAGARACALAAGGSRDSCALGGFRCQAVRSDRGAAVSCARPGGDVSFIAKVWPVRPSAGSG
jgi:hypothetical protein